MQIHYLDLPKGGLSSNHMGRFMCCIAAPEDHGHDRAIPVIVMSAGTAAKLPRCDPSFHHLVAM